ncbi:hypothetical protein CLF_111106 [Clonorchis sinensis]|uniref:Uncharacterized protein n=1 Tax=Clonorchis sinensis TaxID=79923 RepID=G7YLE8_CLOSI|nr:hypothetical protein CLF_111106 [Clonorchis sinensis]
MRKASRRSFFTESRSICTQIFQEVVFSGAGLYWSSSKLRFATTAVSDIRQRHPRCSSKFVSTFCGRLEILEF